jgi:hypothetical protein
MLIAELTPQQYDEIIAFAERELLPSRRADFRAAMQTLITAKAGGGKGAKLTDFMLDTIEQHETPDEEPEQDQDAMSFQLAKMAGLFEAAQRQQQQQEAATPPAE